MKFIVVAENGSVLKSWERGHGVVTGVDGEVELIPDITVYCRFEGGSVVEYCVYSRLPIHEDDKEYGYLRIESNDMVVC